MASALARSKRSSPCAGKTSGRCRSSPGATGSTASCAAAAALSSNIQSSSPTRSASVLFLSPRVPAYERIGAIVFLPHCRSDGDAKRLGFEELERELLGEHHVS